MWCLPCHPLTLPIAISPDHQRWTNMKNMKREAWFTNVSPLQTANYQLEAP
jgi:hypothetical protein